MAEDTARPGSFFCRIYEAPTRCGICPAIMRREGAQEDNFSSSTTPASLDSFSTFPFFPAGKYDQDTSCFSIPSLGNQHTHLPKETKSKVGLPVRHGPVQEPSIRRGSTAPRLSGDHLREEKGKRKKKKIQFSNTTKAVEKVVQPPAKNGVYLRIFAVPCAARTRTTPPF